MRLVLLVAVDQLRRDRLDATLPGGLGRLVREGRRFEQAVLDHAFSDTCPGHVSMSTGRHPGPAGIPGNHFIDRESLELVYCLADTRPDAAPLGTPPGTAGGRGRSPRNLRATALGDWLRAERPGSKVFAVSGKDRAAIALGGQRPDAAYWIDRDASGDFTSSRYYMAALPDWVAQRFNGVALLAAVPNEWRHPGSEFNTSMRADDYHGESDRFGRSFPHPAKTEGNFAASLQQFMVTPYLDEQTLAFSKQLVIEEQLGSDERVDLLAISLSAMDYIGHHYGPFSLESADALAQLDEDLGALLSFLEERTRGRMLVVLTSDHGVLPLPEWVAGHGGSRCRVPGGRVSPDQLDDALTRHLDAALGNEGSHQRGRWFVRERYALIFDPARARATGVAVERLIELSAAQLEQQAGVRKAWSKEEIETSAEPLARLYRNSLAEGRDADLVIELDHGCLFSPFPTGTSHGSPNDYDRDIPLVFWGPGVEPGPVSGPAASVDIAPTLAHELRLKTPPDLDGRPLPLRD